MSSSLIGKILIAIGLIILLGVLTADYTGLSHHKGLGRVEERWLVGGLGACFSGFFLLRRGKKGV